MNEPAEMEIISMTTTTTRAAEPARRARDPFRGAPRLTADELALWRAARDAAIAEVAARPPGRAPKETTR